MSRCSRGARVAVVFLVWCVLSGVVGTWGWQYAFAHGPVPGGCGCFNPAGVPIVLGWGLLGALGGVAVVSAVMGAVGLALFVRHRRHTDPDLEPDADSAALALDDWLSEVATK